MKKAVSITLAALSLMMLCAGFAGCQRNENIVFTGVIEEIYESGSILVSTTDGADFDKAYVGFADNAETPDFTFAPGQTVEITILPEIAESYPVQVQAVKIKLLADADTPYPVD